MSNADVFRSLAQDMASAQEERTKRIVEIKKETAELLKDIGKESKERSAEVSTLLKGFDKEQKEMGTQLRAELSKVKPEIARAEAERKSQAETEVKERSAEVSDLLAGFRKDSAETAAAWRDLVTTMQAKRGVAVAPPPVKPPVAEVIEEEVPVEEVVSEEKARLEEEILSLIGECPEGIRLVEIAERTGVARIKAGNVTRMLVDEGKIRKEGLLYFPV